MTLSLLPEMAASAIHVDDVRMGVNYGLNKVRFPAPVPIPSKVRVAPKVKEVTDIPGGAQVVFEVTFEREGETKPVCVAETVVRVYAG
jgi:acyl dehydratase